MKEHRCIECGEILNGRRDKKFCSDTCRTSYNNNKRLNNKRKSWKIHLRRFLYLKGVEIMITFDAKQANNIKDKYE